VSEAGLAPTEALPVGLPPIGAVIGARFEIVGLLGAGGMGAVYRARDRELDELVALKVLLPEAADDPDAVARFFREVRLARRVTHPNVARTFDGGRDGALRFLTMELVEGPSLRARWPEGSRPPLPEVLRIGAEIARGLAAAHAAGVVHRDLKPDNVLVERARDAGSGASLGERIVLTDFGIARAELAGNAGADRRHETVALVGTPQYMAPEQLRGEPVDGRADVYALGLLLHELLTGRLAFDPHGNPTARALGKAIPEPVRTLAPEVPEALAQLVAEQLAPRREDRPDAQRTLDRLETMRGTASPLDRAPQVPRLSAELLQRARNFTPRTLSLRALEPHDPGARTVAQDLSAAIGDAVTAISSLKLLPASASTSAELAVSGSVALEGARVSVRLRLVDVERRTIAWADRIEGDLGDPFALEDAVTKTLEQVLVAQAGGALRGGPTDPRVRAVYDRAHEAFQRFDAGSVQQAVDGLEEGLRAHPGDAWLSSLLGAALARLFLQQGARDSALFTRAEELSLRALAIDPSIAETFMTIAALRLASGELRAAVRALYEVLERAPLHAQAQNALGKLLVESGYLEEGLPRLELARRLQPGLALAYIEIARTHALLDQRAEAERVIGEAVAVMGEVVGIFPFVRLCFWWGDRALAARTAEVIERNRNGAAWESAVPLLRSYAEGRSEPRAPAVFSRLADDARAAPHQRCLMYEVAAEYFAAVGEAEHALHALERAAELPLVDVAWLDRCPPLALVRDDPRFTRLRAVVAARAAELWA